VIAFARQGKGIFTISPDGTNEKQVTTEPTDTGPALSPDGKKIAFTGVRDGSNGIFVANIDGTELKRLTQNPLSGSYPAWSPDGTRIAFGSSVTNAQGRPSVQLFIMNADGSGVQRVTTGAGGSAAGALSASWSPDGSSIAFEGLGNTGTGICTVEATGGPGTCVKLPNWPHIAAGTEPAWSPDGTLLAFDVQRAHLDDQGHGVPDWHGVGTIGLGGGEPAQLVELGQSASWSPDGSQMVLVLTGDLYTVNADGSSLHQLTRTPETEGSPSWDQ
jgi:TolB protein